MSDNQSDRYRILLVEDNVINYELVIECFEGQPYSVDVAVDGAQGVDMFAAGQYDLVLMDLQLPVMDGLTATGRIRAIERETGRARTPVVAVTANAFARDRELCLAAGMDDYI
ncbi:MAG: response regulator, partial [Rhodocyclaceae bacterium]|nr:response regulator [Rhodocyclaceae bacterium]